MEHLAARPVTQKDLSHRLINTTLATLYKGDLPKANAFSIRCTDFLLDNNGAYIAIESYTQLRDSSIHT